MRWAALGFALGVCLLQRQPSLPGLGWLMLFFALALVGALGFSRGLAPAAAVAATIVGFASLGFAWAASLAHLRLADRLDPVLEGRDLVVTGVVVGLPQAVERGQRFEFDVESADKGVPRHILISSYEGADRDDSRGNVRVRAGERWRFTVRLRRPHGSVNPDGFDYEAWLLERGLRATGYVRREGVRECLSRGVARYWTARLRESVRDRLKNALPGHRFAGVLVALAIGDQRAIDPDQWRLFARTGVSHLMSISGLHVTMVAGLFALVVSWCWRRSEILALALPAQRAAALTGFLAAFAYCLVSGFAVPAQRTLYMVGVAAASLWLGRSASASRVLAAALLFVLVLDPWAVLSPGFWLSFAAVGVIFYARTGRTVSPGIFAQWGRMQWAVTLGLAPLLLVLFHQVSLISPVANAFAIPLVSLVITPLALAGAVLPFGFPLEAGHFLLELLMTVLAWLARLPGAVWHQHAPIAWTVPLALAGIAWLLLPRGVPARGLGALLFVPMFAVTPARPATGELWITVLDVGQGLSVLARTRGHALLYDAGPAFNAFSDSGTRIILPYLRSQGVARLDALVISHNDRDHAGGASSVMASLPLGTLWSSLLPGHPLLAVPAWRLPCAAGRRWTWDGVSFEFLHPSSDARAQGAGRVNDRSCVLRMEAYGGRVLLTGDIERRAERELLRRAPALLPAEALLVPHHGSASSSSNEFVEKVAPRHAVVAAGYRNAFGHPREEVLTRYRRLGAELLRTDLGGAVGLRIAGGRLATEAERDRARHYWHE